MIDLTFRFALQPTKDDCPLLICEKMPSVWTSAQAMFDRLLQHYYAIFSVTEDLIHTTIGQ